jgi:hypothetical protein
MRFGVCLGSLRWSFAGGVDVGFEVTVGVVVVGEAVFVGDELFGLGFDIGLERFDGGAVFGVFDALRLNCK